MNYKNALITTAITVTVLFAAAAAMDRLSSQKRQIEELNELLSQRGENAALRAELEQARYDMFMASNAAEAKPDAELLKRLERAERLAGLTDVSGPGVSVTLNDGGDTVIHDSDLLMLVNELRDAGAEALAINGERLIATSEIRCAGSIVSINNNRYAVPFVISAVGNAETMYNALYLNGGVLDTLRQWNLVPIVEKNNNIEIPAYAGDALPVYAGVE